jgi:hypothetical protein
MGLHWSIQGKMIFDDLLQLFVISGACKQLPGLNLSSGELTDEEFEFLRQYLIESAYTSKEVYNVRSKKKNFHQKFDDFSLQTTTPIEFEKFKTLLSRNKFTMIVDGLNILYGIDRFATDPISSMTKVNERFSLFHQQ